MKKYLILLLLLALALYLGKKYLGKKLLLSIGVKDWEGKKVNVHIAGRSFMVEPRKDFNNVAIGDYVLSSGTFDNIVILSLKKDDKVVETLEIDFNERKIA